MPRTLGYKVIEESRKKQLLLNFLEKVSRLPSHLQENGNKASDITIQRHGTVVRRLSDYFTECKKIIYTHVDFVMTLAKELHSIVRDIDLETLP